MTAIFNHLISRYIYKLRFISITSTCTTYCSNCTHFQVKNHSQRLHILQYKGMDYLVDYTNNLPTLETGCRVPPLWWNIRGPHLNSFQWWLRSHDSRNPRRQSGTACCGCRQTFSSRHWSGSWQGRKLFGPSGTGIAIEGNKWIVNHGNKEWISIFSLFVTYEKK